MAITLYDFIEKDFVTKSFRAVYNYGVIDVPVVDDGYTYDGNLGTYTGYSKANVSNGDILTFYYTYTFSVPVSISYVGLRAYASAGRSGYDTSSTRYVLCTATGKTSGSHQLISTTETDPSANPGDFEVSSLSYTDIIKIDGVIEAHAISGFSGSGGSIGVRLYELSVNGVFDVPSKIRVRASGGTKRLAKLQTSDLSYSPLHCCESSGVVSALRLVDTTSVAASPLRINTSSGIKSVALYSGDY